MNVVVKASLILAGAVAVLSIVVYATGLHQSFLVSQIVFLVGAIALNAGVVIWALGKTASENGYGKQVANAAGIGVLGGVLIILVSWLLLSTVFPDVLAEMRQGAITYMDSAGMSEEQVARQMEALDSTTPWSQSVTGGVGTFFTSLVCGAVYAIFKRKK